MIREIDLEAVSDGKLYGPNDMVKADCQDCKGCSACCKGMGNSIVLDPLDIYLITTHLGCKFEGLLEDKMELNLAEGAILPNLKMQENEECCAFLSGEGRCTIHAFRPGICRLFPLGRVYENNGFQYFLQIHECLNPNRTKVKVKKWIDVQEYKKYETFIIEWHYFLKEVKEMISQNLEEEWIKKLNMYVLNSFYLEAFHPKEDFYEQFGRRMKAAREFLENMKSKIHSTIAESGKIN